MNRVRNFIEDHQGSATIEFALMSALFFIVIVVALDFGMYIRYRERLGQAVQQASVIAFNERSGDISTVRGNMQSFVRTASGLGATVTVTAGCNGTTSCTNASASPAPQCACVSGAPPSNVYTNANCGSACASGSTAGYYFTVKATYPYQAVVLRNGILNNKIMTQEATVRLQ